MTTAFQPQTYLARALADGHAAIAGEGRNERIHYVAAGHSERWADPEEKVRAELWAELIYKYEYAPELIAFEVNVPRRTPNDYADLVIYSDGAMKMPYFVIECKRADISDAAFNQAIEQACGNRASLGANYCGVVVGLTRRLLRFVAVLLVVAATAACILGDEPEVATPTPDLSATIDAALAKLADERAAKAADNPTRALAATATRPPTPTHTANNEPAGRVAGAVNSPTSTLLPTTTPKPMPTAISATTPERPTEFDTLLNAGYLESKSPYHAKSILELPWIADGIDVSEREAATQLIQLAAFNERIFTLIMYSGEAQAPYALDWIHDTITGAETEALQQLGNIAHNDAAIAEQVIALHWIADDITELEIVALQQLGGIAHNDAATVGQVVALPWIVDGVTESEIAGLQQLGNITHNDATVAKQVIALPWVGDGVTESEIAGLQQLRNIAHNDAATAGQVVALPWVVDGVTESEIAGLQQLGSVTHNDATVAKQVIALSWVADGVTQTEISAIRYIPYHSPAVTKQAIELPWIADGVTVSEIPAIRSITYHDATTVQQIIALPWVADGISEAERFAIMSIPYHHYDVVNGENHPNQRYMVEKQYMLTLINQERIKAGVPTITMGDNISAQIHAEDMLHNCYLAHKGLDGRQPHERFEDHGGEPSRFGGENIIGRDECLIPHAGSQPENIPSRDVEGNMIGWMNSPGHRTNLLVISHCKVHIGIAWNGYTSRMVQLFESDGTYRDEPCSIRD